MENESPRQSDLGSSIILHKNQSISTQRNHQEKKGFINPPPLANGTQGQVLVDCIEAVRDVNSRMDELHTITEPLIKNIKEMAPHHLLSEEVKIDENKAFKSNVQLQSVARLNNGGDMEAAGPAAPVQVVNLGQMKEGTVDEFIAAQGNKQRRKLVAKADGGDAQ